jgi:hypothetical protein
MTCSVTAVTCSALVSNTILAVPLKETTMKSYVTKDGINLYDVFKAGASFGRLKADRAEVSLWTEAEWVAALEASLPQTFVASLKSASAAKAGVGREKSLMESATEAELGRSPHNESVRSRLKT